MPYVGELEQIWRYPVKSMGGERLKDAYIDVGGLRGDRIWAVRDEEKGVITGGKKMPALMLCSARFLEEPTIDRETTVAPAVAITLPDGTELRSDAPSVHERLSHFLGRQVTLQRIRPASERHHYRAEKTTASSLRDALGLAQGEPLPDFSAYPLKLMRELGQYATPRGTYFDAYPLHMLTTATLEVLRTLSPQSDFDVRRFRPNFVVHTGEDTTFVELAWCDGRLRMGANGFVARVHVPTTRCSMTMRAQRELRADPSVLKTIAGQANRCVGVYGGVDSPGRVRMGDPIDLAPLRISKLEKWARARSTQIKRLLLKAAEAALPKG